MDKIKSGLIHSLSTEKNVSQWIKKFHANQGETFVKFDNCG